MHGRFLILDLEKDGYDIGKSVQKIWGDSDYEYTHIVEPHEVTKFYKIFNIPEGDRTALRKELKKCFSVNEDYSLFVEFKSEYDPAFAIIPKAKLKTGNTKRLNVFPYFRNLKRKDVQP